MEADDVAVVGNHKQAVAMLRKVADTEISAYLLGTRAEGETAYLTGTRVQEEHALVVGLDPEVLATVYIKALYGPLDALLVQPALWVTVARLADGVEE